MSSSHRGSRPTSPRYRFRRSRVCKARGDQVQHGEHPTQSRRATDELDLVEAVLDERLKLLGSSEVAVKRKTSVATNDCDVC